MAKVLEAMTAIADYLIVRLISSDLKAQFVGQLMKLGIWPYLSKGAIDRLITTLMVSLNEQDGEKAGQAMQDHFEEFREAVGEAIRFRDDKPLNSAVH